MKQKQLIKNIKGYLFKSQRPAPNNLATDSSIADKDSPYAKGRAAWDERYGATIVQLENSYRLNALQLIINGALAIGLIHMAGQSKIIPYIVQVDSTGGVVSGMQAQRFESGNVSDAAVTNQLIKFVMYARGVTGDPDVNQQNIYAAQSLVNGSAAATLSNYYQQNNPLVIDKNNKVQIQMLYENKRTANSYELAWTETTTTLNDQVISQKNYIAEVTYKLGDVKDVNYNPLGLYITDISWTNLN